MLSNTACSSLETATINLHFKQTHVTEAIKTYVKLFNQDPMHISV